MQAPLNLPPTFSKAFLLKFITAVDYMMIGHAGQVRKDGTGTPYATHPLNVARRLIDAGVTDEDVILAALFHDLLEDTPVTYDELCRHFGPNVANLVREVTDNKQLNKSARKRAQIEHAAKISDKAKLIKAADKMSNLASFSTSTPQGWDEKRIRGYFLWSEAVWRSLQEGIKGSPIGIVLQDKFDHHEMDIEGRTVKTIPNDPQERDALLETYLQDMEKCFN
jgi:(p)ppGpp synthase/HD superfamily hydrolase